MRKSIFTEAFCFSMLMFLNFAVFNANCQTLKPQVYPSAAGSYTDANGTVSWTIGEPLNAAFSNAGGSLNQGEQQYYTDISLVNLRAFIQGFYTGSGQMNAVINPVTRPLECDTITLRLVQATAPYSILSTSTAILSTTGNATFRFPISLVLQPYYLVLSHRNCLDAWSSSPVTLNASTTYNFTGAASSAYGNNLADLGDGNFAIWSGDVDRNGRIDGTDFTIMETATLNFRTGYVLYDLTGDGITETADYSLLENNCFTTKTIARP